MWLTKSYLLLCCEQDMSIVPVRASSKLIFSLKSCQTFIDQSSISISNYFSKLRIVFKEKAQRDIQELDAIISDSFLVIPDHWAVRMESEMELVPSQRVHHLAGLALASETLHLPPELVLYSSKVTAGNMRIKACSVFILEQLQTLVKTKNTLKGVLLLSDLQQLISTHKQLSIKNLTAISLTSYQQKLEQQDARPNRWALLIMLILVSQVGCFWCYLKQKQISQESQQTYISQKAQTVRLHPSKTSSLYENAIDILQTLPIEIRFNGFKSEFQQVNITLTGENAFLDKQLLVWQKEWPTLDFKMHADSNRLSVSNSNKQNHLMGTRSVQDVVIEIFEKEKQH